jgi:predicted nucleic acid-binding protein
MLLVICDATPLIYLARIERFDLLRALHEAVLIPPAVWAEVAVQGGHLAEGKLVRKGAAEGWLRMEQPRLTLTLTAAEAKDLDPGETEAIRLALEHKALLAIDEARGRAVALRLGLRITGTVGLLMRARRQGLIPNLRTDLDRLRSETTFRLSESVYRQALLAVGETDT